MEIITIVNKCKKKFTIHFDMLNRGRSNRRFQANLFLWVPPFRQQHNSINTLSCEKINEAEPENGGQVNNLCHLAFFSLIFLSLVS